jgi:nitrate reductase gamma subunit
LIQGKFNLKHFQVGSIVLVLIVLGSIGGMAVTYINNGKLFVGPHLLAGMGMTGLVAGSAALSPLMQKGSTWARYTHIGLNMIILGLFSWQALTGVQIVQRILTPTP